MAFDVVKTRSLASFSGPKIATELDEEVFVFSYDVSSNSR
jgi:hypothetical protein